MRPRRSALYLPGSNARAIEKAKSLAADAIILDLEDSVAPEEKEAARYRVRDAVQAGGFGLREVVIRINGWDTPHGISDFEAALDAGADAILIPKVETAEVLQAVAAHAQTLGKPVPALWAMIETPLAILNLHEIAKTASAGVPLRCFVAGTNDLLKAARAKFDLPRTALLPALCQTVAAARAYGLAALDGVFNALGDDAGFRGECLQGRLLGMDGKTLIHPAQIDACNEVFSPSVEEIADAQAIADAFALPENAAKGAIRLNSKMVERLHADIAAETLALARAIEAMADGRSGH